MPQGKFSLYNRCFYDVNGMVYTTFTIVNILLILYQLFFTLCIFDGFITTVVLRVFLIKFLAKSKLLISFIYTVYMV